MAVLTAISPEAKSTAIAELPPKQNQPTVIVDFIWRISIDQYHQMIKTGILTDDDPVELLEGLLVQKMPKNPAHSLVTRLLLDKLPRLIPSGWYVNFQEPVTTTDSEPEPDVAIVRGDRFDYLDRHPVPEETALVMEIADATLRQDRGIKKRLYARAGVPVYWIVNLKELQIEVYSQPDPYAEEPDYRQRQLYHSMDQIAVVVDGIEVSQISVHEILPHQLANKSEG